ncbi:MAG: hypothetical protein ACJ72N_23760 [Labedaea sp.]
MSSCKLRAQASLWENGDGRSPVLVMEGEAADRGNGGNLLPDALYRVVLSRGLHLTTDLVRLDRRPVLGWRVRIEPDGSTTLIWPRFHPLLDHAPLDLPKGWLRLAAVAGQIQLFVGYDLGMGDGTQAHPLARLETAAETGALVSGALPVQIDAAVPSLPQQRATTTEPAHRTRPAALPALAR